MNLIKEEENTLIIQCNLCKNESSIDKKECKKTEEGFEIETKLKCVACGQEDSSIIDYKKMLRQYNLKEKNENLISFENEKKQKEVEDHNKVDIVQILCPNCKSKNVRRISGINKVSSVMVLGIFALGKLIKTYECKECKYRW